MAKEETKLDVGAALKADLPKEAEQRTKGKETGRGYDTSGYGYAYISERLNDVFGIRGWNVKFSLIDIEERKTSSGRATFDATVLCLIDVSRTLADQGAEALAPTWREMYGGHNSVLKPDAIKGAATNAFKKCAALFGAGNDAYKGVMDEDFLPIGDAGELGEPVNTKAPNPYPSKWDDAPPPATLSGGLLGDEPPKPKPRARAYAKGASPDASPAEKAATKVLMGVAIDLSNTRSEGLEGVTGYVLLKAIRDAADPEVGTITGNVIEHMYEAIVNGDEDSVSALWEAGNQLAEHNKREYGMDYEKNIYKKCIALAQHKNFNLTLSRVKNGENEPVGFDPGGTGREFEHQPSGGEEDA